MNRIGLVGVVSVAFCSASAVAAPDARAVASNVRVALGADAAQGASSLVTLSGTCDFLGERARCRFAFDDAGRMGYVIEGRLGQTVGVDGAIAWEERLGFGRMLELAEHDDAMIFAGALTGSWANENSAITLGGVEQNDDGSTVEVEFTSPGGVSGVIEVDTATWLPREVRWTTHVESAIEIERYTKAGKTLAPSVFTMRTSGSQEQRFQLEPAEIADGAGLLTARVGRPQDAVFDSSAPSALEIKRAPTGHLLVHPMVNGKDVGWFIFDTGAGVNCITPTAAETLGLDRFGRIMVSGAGGRLESGFHEAETMTLGPVTVAAPRFVEIDFGQIGATMGVEIAGVIGFDFFARCVAEVDMSAGTIALHDPATYSLPEGAAWEELLLSGRHPCVRATFEGREGVFKIDTGATGWVIFHFPAVERLGLLQGRDTAPSRLRGVGGFVEAQSGTIESFEVGGKRFNALRATFTAERKGANADPYTTGLIGAEVVRAFTLILDYGGDRIALVERE